MNTRLRFVLPIVVVLAACGGQKSSPVAPSSPETSDVSAPTPVAPTYPSNGPDLIAFVAARYPERLAEGVSRDQRIQNMMFLRDRIIEIGKCGGMDLGWNLKRGGPEVSIDFITERRDGRVYGHDIASDYDNSDRPLKLYWGGGDHPTYKEFPEPRCK
jgi:hypothetical protein